MQSIDPIFLHTPVLRGSSLDRALGVELLGKIETLNPIRSFKGRGTEWFAASLHDRDALVCASAGNFGQGLARAAVRRGIALTVFAAERANTLKIAAMRALGAEVRLSGSDFDAAKVAAREFAHSSGSRYVEDGAIAEIAEGAGTIALELTEAGMAPDVMLVPLGNGALATGVGTWLRHAAPATRVIGVVAAGAPAMRLSYQARRVVATAAAHTIADGIAVREPVPYAVACMDGTIDDVIEVSDAATLRAMRLLHEHAGLVIEPSGAVGVAALVEHADAWRGARVATVLCGGNVTTDDARRWLIV